MHFRDAGRFRYGRGPDRGDHHLRPPIWLRPSDPAAARLSPDASDVAKRGAHPGAPFHRHLRRSPRLRPQRLPQVGPGPRAVFQTSHGARHGGRHGAARFSPLLGRRARPGRSRRLSPRTRSPAARASDRSARRHSDREAWARSDARFALAFWPWSLLAQPEPFPERLLAAAPEAVVDDALGGWGSSPAAFSADVRAAYVEALRDPARVHAICEEYRAAATCDREHDQADLRAGRRIAGPVLALWSGKGPLNAWYAEEGGPLALWRSWADDVHGHSVDAGHFFPEEIPGETADALTRFFR